MLLRRNKPDIPRINFASDFFFGVFSVSVETRTQTNLEAFERIRDAFELTPWTYILAGCDSTG